MKLERLFYSSVVCALASFVCDGSAFALSRNCSAGQYAYLSTKCKACPSNCYCPTNGSKTGTGYTGLYCKAGQVYANTNKGLGTEFLDVHACPTSYPKSAEGSGSQSSCYDDTTCSGTKLYYKKIKFEPGQYVKACSMNPASCPSGKVCKGGSAYGFPDGIWPRTSDYGAEACPSGKQPNAKQTACEEPPKPKTFKCIAGEYLPANSETCAACPSGKLCLGGEWEKRAIAQGDDGKCAKDEIINEKGNACTKCPLGQKANSTYTECVEGDPIKVNPGEYLPANSITPKKCTSARKFCPGGEFSFLSTDQGQYECPTGGEVSKDKKSCILTLTKMQMMCGQQGSRKDQKTGIEQCISKTPCWIKTDPEDYINCIYGVRFDVENIKEDKQE